MTDDNYGDADFVVVANRLPVDRVTEGGKQTWQTSPGGLVTALEPVMKAQGGAWVGWAGAPDETVRAFDHEGYRVQPVRLTAQEVKEYYEGFSNATLWPLYHDSVAFPEFHREWWDAMVAVNKKFARATAKVAAENATVWIQDYQLHLVPSLLRELRPDLTIGFFLHIPFPPVELFLQIPWREELVEGLLGADVIGFQVRNDAHNFVRLAKRLVPGVRTRQQTVTLPDGHEVLVKAYPISLDYEEFLALSRRPEVIEETEKLREELGNPKKILLGVDRLDYTKGLRERVKAVGELFAAGQLDPDEVVFIQVATPSRERVEEYRRLRDDVEQLVGRINSRVGRIGRPPIAYRQSNHSRAQLAAMYRLADVMLVTPLRDGMNLVAKEYVTCHDSDDGALVLSEFAGAAQELRRAYLVNPYDIEGMKKQIMHAVRDPRRVRFARMKALRTQVSTYPISVWAQSFLADLQRVRDED